MITRRECPITTPSFVATAAWITHRNGGENSRGLAAPTGRSFGIRRTGRSEPSPRARADFWPSGARGWFQRNRFGAISRVVRPGRIGHAEGSRPPQMEAKPWPPWSRTDSPTRNCSSSWLTLLASPSGPDRGTPLKSNSRGKRLYFPVSRRWSERESPTLAVPEPSVSAYPWPGAGFARPNTGVSMPKSTLVN